MMEAWLYFMDEFRTVDIDVDVSKTSTSEEGLKTLVKLRDYVKGVLMEKYNVKPLQIKPYRFYRGDEGVLFEYTVILENGSLSAKLMISKNPVQLLYEYYNWEYLKI